MEDFCFCGSGKRKNNCHPYINPDSLVGSVIKLYSSWDRYLQKEKISQKIKFVCDQKCNHCCNNYFYISEKEYLTIYSYLKVTYDKAYIVKKINEAQLYMSYLNEHFPEEYNKINTVIPKNYKGSIYGFYNDDIKRDQVHPCIFLNTKTGLCDIYPVRPIICRLHGVTFHFTACDKILRMPNYPQRMVDLDSFPDKEKIYQMDFISASKTVPMMYRRSYPIADWFASTLPQQLAMEDEYLSCSYLKTEIDFHNLAYNRHITR